MAQKAEEDQKQLQYTRALYQRRNQIVAVADPVRREALLCHWLAELESEAREFEWQQVISEKAASAVEGAWTVDPRDAFIKKIRKLLVAVRRVLILRSPFLADGNWALLYASSGGTVDGPTFSDFPSEGCYKACFLNRLNPPEVSSDFDRIAAVWDLVRSTSLPLSAAPAHAAAAPFVVTKANAAAVASSLDLLCPLVCQDAPDMVFSPAAK